MLVQNERSFYDLITKMYLDLSLDQFNQVQTELINLNTGRFTAILNSDLNIALLLKLRIGNKGL